MRTIFKYSNIKIANVETDFIRYLFYEIKWKDRLIGITGARGTGKTTLMLQYIKKTFGHSYTALYISMDDYYFTQKRLFELAEEFYINGGRNLFIDEVHKYPLWAIEIKNLYDTYSDLKIVFSGSSALELYKSDVDLSRRAAIYKLHELSFREFLNLSTGEIYDTYSLPEILDNHHQITPQIVGDKSIFPEYKIYLEKGAYPFFMETEGQYYDRLKNTINVIIETDLPSIENINYQTTQKLRKLISLIADSVPFKVNISELSRKTNISRDVLLRLLHLLERANLTKGIKQKGAATGHLTKPDKIYLNNSVLLYALNSNIEASMGTVRETFFMNQLMLNHQVNSVSKGDFLIDKTYTFEIGGRNKTKKQIIGIENAFVAADGIEHGFKDIIPLWLFGFLY
ncbi:MAG: putative AAA+ superfamily ATPase [Salibacteraceae bacterium]|jgi:predicted AAA+ superfamily ATPase